MKLSKAQAEVLATAKRYIEKARTEDFVTWCGKNYKIIDEYEGYRQRLETRYQNGRDGIAYVGRVNSKTLQALESMGLIEIVYDSCGQSYGEDMIRLVEA